MIEFRIYYECLEQAHHYIKPIVHSATIKYETEVKLVRGVRNEKQFPDGVIRAIHSLVKPDILITAVASGKETPLVLIEFMEAVTTEDHELQRLRGAVGAYLARMFYLKVSGPKISKTNFGGAPYNPYSTPRIFAEKLCYEGYIIANWETEPDNLNILKRTPGLPGCPPEIPILSDTIQKAVQAFCENLTDWFAPALQMLQVTESYKKFSAQVNLAPSLDDLLNAWSKREERKSKSPKSGSLNSLRFFVREDQIRAKIYRFSHSMNPDSGILTFISILLSDSRSVFGIYALVRSKGLELLKEDLKDFNLLQPKLNAALEKDKGGIPAWLEKEIQLHVLTKARTLNDTIDFQGVWEANRDKIMENDVVMTLAYFLDGIYLNYNGVKLQWDRYSLLGGQGGNFIELLRKRLGFDIPSIPSPLKEVVDSVNEDEVTYAIAHRVLLPNNFRVVAISYPGSQGGWPILPDEKKGKSQPRKYPDITALPPVNATSFDALINENYCGQDLRTGQGIHPGPDSYAVE